MPKYQLIPPTLLPEQTEAWLRNSCKDSFNDEYKHIFEEGDLNEFARESSQRGGELIELDFLAKIVSEAIQKGTEGIVIDIPETDGVAFLKASRIALDKKVKNGYEMIQRKIYGIPSDETNEMVYFDAAGNIVLDRCRPLSAKEITDYFGLFAQFNKTGTEDK